MAAGRALRPEERVAGNQKRAVKAPKRAGWRGCTLFPLFAAMACGDGGSSAGGSGAVVRDSAGVTIMESSDPGVRWTVDPVPLLVVGEADGAETHLLARVGDALTLPDGGVALADGGSGQLRLYGPDGGFQGSFGGPGDGPGEFRQLSAPLGLLEDGGFLLWDLRHRRITRTGPGLELVGTTTLQPVEGTSGMLLQGRFGGGTLLVSEVRSAPPLSGEFRDTLRLHRADSTGRPLNPLIAVGGGGGELRIDGGPDPATIRSISVIGTPMGIQTFVAAGDTLLLAGSSDSFQALVVHRDGSLRRIHRLVASRRPLGEAERQAFIEHLAASSPSADDTRTFYEGVRFPTELPAFDQFVRDSEGFLWIRAFLAPFEEGNGLWHVLDPRGVWVASVELPGRLRVTRIGNHEVLGVFLDDLEVESVRRYRLERAPADG